MRALMDSGDDKANDDNKKKRQGWLRATYVPSLKNIGLTLEQLKKGFAENKVFKVTDDHFLDRVIPASTPSASSSTNNRRRLYSLPDCVS